jgi:Ser/Thr protein kinase RdoA (MazF antagonist)
MKHSAPASTPVPPEVSAAWGLDHASLRPLGSGLINRTWRALRDGVPCVLQQVNPLFAPEVNTDIAAVTAHLCSKGRVTPEIIPTTAGALWAPGEGGHWRLQTLIAGVTPDQLATDGQARAAGALLAAFHGALADFRYTFVHRRPGVHDTPRHLQNLRLALLEHPGHSGFSSIQPVAQDILGMAGELEPLAALPERTVHGDPKINNILFDASTEDAICLVDLDTLGPMPLPLELGDAFRSWCNPAGEDSDRATFSLPLFAGAVAGYASVARPWIKTAEVVALVPATLTIYVELAARFCADALNEKYFGWDPARYPSRSAHNLVRARSQLAAARSLLAQQSAAEAVVWREFSGG